MSGPTTQEEQSANAVAPKMRGRGIDLSSLSPEELKLHKRDIHGKSRKNRSDRKKAASFVYDSATEPTKAEVFGEGPWRDDSSRGMLPGSPPKKLTRNAVVCHRWHRTI